MLNSDLVYDHIYTEDIVVQNIYCLHENHTKQSNLSNFIVDFQETPQAWEISLHLLIRCIPENLYREIMNNFSNMFCLIDRSQLNLPLNIPLDDTRNLILFYCSQTLCKLSLCGFQRLHAISKMCNQPFFNLLNEARILVNELIFSYSNFFPSPTIRQLCLALSCNILFTMTSQMEMTNMPTYSLDVFLEFSSNPLIANQLQSFTTSLLKENIDFYFSLESLYPILLLLLLSLPEVLNDQRLALTSNEKIICKFLLLSSSKLIFNTVISIFQKQYNISILHLRPSNFSILPFNITNPDFKSSSLRLTILETLLCWFELIIQYKQCYTLPSNPKKPNSLAVNIKHPEIQGIASLLMETAVLPLVLINFHYDIVDVVYLHFGQLVHSDFNQIHLNPTKLVFSDVSNSFPHDNLRISETTCKIINVESLLITGLLEYLYVFYHVVKLYASEDKKISYYPSELIPIINISNFDILLCLFNGMISIYDSIVELYTSKFVKNNFSCRDLMHLSLKSNDLVGYPRLIDVIPYTVLYNFYSIMVKFSEIFLPPLIYSIQFDSFHTEENKPLYPILQCYENKSILLEKFQEILYFMILSWSHSSVKLRSVIIDFWSSFVGNQYIQQHIQLENSVESHEYSPSIVKCYSLENNKMIMTPIFNNLISMLVNCLKYGSDNLLDHSNFSFEEWFQYRDQCSLFLSDLAYLVDYSLILEVAGKLLITSFKQMENSSNQWINLEVAYFLLTSVASRAKAGEDSYIPFGIKICPNLNYSELNILPTYILKTTISRFILWTSGYIGSNYEMFSQCFNFLKNYLISLLNLYRVLNVDESIANIKCFRHYSECVVIEAINSICEASFDVAFDNIRELESRITIILNHLAELIMIDELLLENRCSLIILSGSLIQYFSSEKKKNTTLIFAFYQRLQNVLKNNYNASSIENRISESFKLFFVSLESINLKSNANSTFSVSNTINEVDNTEINQLFLSLMEEYVPVFENCFYHHDNNEMILESVCHCIVHFFSTTTKSIGQLTYVYNLIDYVIDSFMRKQSTYQLATIRSLIQIFGSNNNEFALNKIKNAYLQVTDIVLRNVKNYNSYTMNINNPDVLGMALDCTNTILLSPALTDQILPSSTFKEFYRFIMNFSNKCLYTKVFITMVLFLSRFISLIQSHNEADSIRRENSQFVLCEKNAQTVMGLLKNYDFLPQTILCLFKILTEVYQDKLSWIGLVTNIFYVLLKSVDLVNETYQNIETILSEYFQHIVPPNIHQNLTMKILSSLNYPIFYKQLFHALLDFSDQCETNWRKHQHTTNNNK